MSGGQTGEAHSPLTQFQINNFVDAELFGFDISFTNSALFMALSTTISVIFFFLATRKAQTIPSKFQLMAESIYDFVENILVDNTGVEGKKFFPLALSLFLFVVVANLLGMVPYSFTVPSHIVVTFALSALLFLVVIIAAFMKHGVKFLSIFVPSGAPGWMLPLLITVEFFAYLIRPASLAIRLAANMTAGHTMLKVISGFIVSLGFALGWLPFAFVLVLTGFEIFVAILQAYIFTILACVYLNDAVHLSH
jgi:F-type H+-transporting ATPase subunit a